MIKKTLLDKIRDLIGSIAWRVYMEYQLSLFDSPMIESAHGQEWITGYDSTGTWRFFSRPIGQAGPFFNEFAGPRKDWSTCGEGEAIDSMGNLVPGFNPPKSYRKFLHGWRWDPRCKKMGIDYIPLPGDGEAGEAG